MARDSLEARYREALLELKKLRYKLEFLKLPEGRYAQAIVGLSETSTAIRVSAILADVSVQEGD